MNQPPAMKILLWPHPSLKQACKPVEAGDTEFRAQLEEMQKLAARNHGVGLAANQVGLDKRMLVARADDGTWRHLINPKIFEFTGRWQTMREGCLSIPGYFETVRRCTQVAVEHQYIRSELGVITATTVVETFDGMLAHILQHEIEHLDGKMFIDNLPAGGRDRLRAAMRRGRR